MDEQDRPSLPEQEWYEQCNRSQAYRRYAIDRQTSYAEYLIDLRSSADLPRMIASACTITEALRDYYRAIGRTFCNDCLTTDDHGQWHDISGYPSFMVCDDCHDELYSTCEDCNRTAHNDQMEYIHGRNICRDCYNEQYSTCDDCGTVVDSDDICYLQWQDRYLCQNCYHDNDNDSDEIEEYHAGHYRHVRFFGTEYHDSTVTYIGVETELEFSRVVQDRGDLLREARAIFPSDLIHYERDGSLNDGCEIITEPMTFDYLNDNREQIARALSYLAGQGCRSHDTSTCGLHVHLSWASMGELQSERDYNVTKLLYLTERFWDDLCTLARRTGYDVEQWAKKYNASTPEDAEQEMLRSKNSHDRYHCWNLTNDATIEYRMSRGTLEPTTWYATVSLVVALVDTACRLSHRQIQQAQSLRGLLTCNGEMSSDVDAYLASKGL